MSMKPLHEDLRRKRVCISSKNVTGIQYYSNEWPKVASKPQEKLLLSDKHVAIKKKYVVGNFGSHKSGNCYSWYSASWGYFFNVFEDEQDNTFYNHEIYGGIRNYYRFLFQKESDEEIKDRKDLGLDRINCFQKEEKDSFNNPLMKIKLSSEFLSITKPTGVEEICCGGLGWWNIWT